MTDQPIVTERREWFADGLRFECTQCGNCCTGPPGFVWIAEQEGRAIAKLLGLSEAEFYRQHAHKIDGRWSLNEHQTEHGHDCVFLDRATVPGKAGCSIYQARPAQCRTWPFWPDNLRSQRSWISAKHLTPCPGMDQGGLVPVDRIRVLVDATP